jgi:hypothetical protein
MIPSLAAYDSQSFSEHFLHKAMAHLLTQFDKPIERNVGKPLSQFVSKWVTSHNANLNNVLNVMSMAHVTDGGRLPSPVGFVVFTSLKYEII